MIPEHIKKQVWDLLRPYKDYRFKISVFIFRPSVDVEAILKAMIGRDPG